ncbi:MAG: protein kinase domain-containing protein [Ornithinibacter sp.]
MGDQGDAVTTVGWRGAGEQAAGPVGEDDHSPGLPTVPQPPQVPGYELGELLARGGSSEVWAGVAHDGAHRVAVKVVHAELDALEVASREATVSARSASAHVVPVEACVPLPDGRVAVVMPHLLGGALDALVRARGHLSPGEVVTVLAPVASALGRLHDLGVVHGDVSPGNVLLDLDGRPLLADLGLGHVVGDVSPGVWGTDGYVAPEVLLGADPTPASDVYSLGALGWLCLTGTVPGPPGLRPELSDVCLAGEGSEPVVSALAMAVSAEAPDRPGAHELAWLLFAAAEPEPLRLVHGDDQVSAVTYRLRAAAGRPPAHSGARRRRWPSPRLREGGRRVLNGRFGRPPWPPGKRATTQHPARAGRHGGGVVRRGWGLPVARSRVAAAPVDGKAAEVSQAPAAGKVPAVGKHPRVVSVTSRRRRPRPARAAVSTAVLCLALLLLVVLGTAVLGRAGDTAQARPGVDAGRTAGGPPTSSGTSAAGSTSTARPTSTAAGSTAFAAGTDPRTDARAPATRPSELLTVLADARAAAWREASPALLHAADARGSAVAARDAADVAEVERTGLRYTGLHYSVADVSVVVATTQRAVLKARVDVGPYVITAATGSTQRPAVAGVPVLVDLVRADVGWRMADLRPVR